MRKRGVGFALLALFLSPVAPRAADLGYSPLHQPYGATAEAVRPVVVVPACAESHQAVLMRCEPRREIAWPEDVGLIRIERSLGRPAPLPYRQLFTWP